MNEVMLGRAHHHVILRIIGREFPNAVDNEDAQWLRTGIEVAVGGMRASLPDVTLAVGELGLFLEDLERLIGGGTRVARLDSIEEWIDLVIEMNSRGALEARGRVRDAPGNELTFIIDDLDQTYLPPLVDALSTALSPYV